MEWQPIDTAPKDGRLIIVGHGNGVWVACYDAIFPSGYKPSNPWRSMLLNHDHIRRNHSLEPTHWMPLPKAPNALGQGSAACGASPAPTSCAANSTTNDERTEK